MKTFTTANVKGRYVTVNEHGTPVDQLWREHRCLICQSPLYPKEHTFCAICKFVQHQTVMGKTHLT